MSLARPRSASAPIIALVAVLSVLGAAAPTARAIPIGVRAKTHVVLEHRRGPAGLVLVGRLLDDASQPIADERISLELPGMESVARFTDEAGRFEVPLNAREVSRLRRDGDLVTWTVRFDGNSRFGDTAEIGNATLSKRSTRLSVTAGNGDGPIVLGERPVDITVALADVSDGTERPIAQAEVALEVGKGSQLVGATGRSGGATFVVRPASFAGGGRYHITARFAGDSLHAPSRAETELSVLVPARITLRVVREGDEQQGRFRMSGRVSDERQPLAGQVVAIIATHGGDRAFELVAATDVDGVFVTALSAVELQALRTPLGALRDRVRLDVRARFAPADGLHAPAESAIVALEIPPPPGVPLRWYLLGLALVVAFIALARALRSGALARGWEAALAAGRRLIDRLRGHRPEPLGPDPEPAFVTRFEPPERERARTSDTLSGIIVDAHTRVPLPGRLTARSGSDVRTVQADPTGRFSLGPLASGAWLVGVEAPGHLPREVALEVPHNGDYDGAQWALIAVHRSVREIFAGTLQGLGTNLAWGYATPREASRDALATLDNPYERAGIEPPLGELTQLVEHTHYAALAGTAADVERARALRQSLEKRPMPEEPQR